MQGGIMIIVKGVVFLFEKSNLFRFEIVVYVFDVHGWVGGLKWNQKNEAERMARKAVSLAKREQNNLVTKNGQNF